MASTPNIVLFVNKIISEICTLLLKMNNNMQINKMSAMLFIEL